MPSEFEELQALFQQLMSARSVPFPQPGGRLDATGERGVYVIFDPRGVVMHVGRTPRARGGIQQRLKGHLAGRSSFVRKHLKGKRRHLRSGYHFRALAVGDGRLRALLEAYATGQLCPQHLGFG